MAKGDFPVASIDLLGDLVSNSALAPNVAEALKSVLEFCWAAKAEKDSRVAMEMVALSGKFLSRPDIMAIEQKLTRCIPALRDSGQAPVANIVTDLLDSHKNLHAKGFQMASALFMYANPDSYYAMSFAVDRPAGDFSRDFSKVPSSVYEREMPGKKARAALFGNEEQAPSKEHLRLIAAE